MELAWHFSDGSLTRCLNRQSPAKSHSRARVLKAEMSRRHFMAESLMKAWQVSPVVSAVTLSAASQAITKELHSHVSGVSTQGNVLRWDQLDEALPLPINFENALMKTVLPLTDLEAFDKEMLHVSNRRRVQTDD